MGSFRLGGMTLGSLFKKPETLLYPTQTKPPYPGQKGHVVNDAEKCILCGMCERVCPCHCITVDKQNRTWQINPFMCIQCGSCVRACPKQCLTMEGTYTPISTKKYDITIEVPKQEKDKKASSEETVI